MFINFSFNDANKTTNTDIVFDTGLSIHRHYLHPESLDNAHHLQRTFYRNHQRAESSEP